MAEARTGSPSEIAAGDRAVEHPGPEHELGRVRPVRRPARWVGSVVVAVVVAMIVNALVTNENFRWDVVGRYFFAKSILAGLLLTLELTAIAMVGALILGSVLAIMRISSSPLLKGAAGAYVWFFRGTPLLVQVIFLYNISALYPSLSLGIPFGPEFVSGNVNQLITPFVAAALALTLNEAAYMAEIVRAGITSVDEGQLEAGRAFGMPRGLILRLIVLPQAMRVIVPPSANELISLLKYTSLVSVIALPELLQSAQLVFQRTFQTIPLLLVASLWYLIVTTVLTLGQMALERRFSRSKGRRGGSNLARFGRGFWPRHATVPASAT